jgi:hypothetical protein
MKDQLTETTFHYKSPALLSGMFKTVLLFPQKVKLLGPA